MASILIVDDEITISRLVSLLLEGEGLACQSASTGSDGLIRLSAAMPDLLVLDVLMPDISGPDFLSQAREAGFEGPVLFLTAADRQEALLDELETLAGDQNVVLKPFDPSDLVRRVTQLLATSNSA